MKSKAKYTIGVARDGGESVSAVILKSETIDGELRSEVDSARIFTQEFEYDIANELYALYQECAGMICIDASYMNIEIIRLLMGDRVDGLKPLKCVNGLYHELEKPDAISAILPISETSTMIQLKGRV